MLFQLLTLAIMLFCYSWFHPCYYAILLFCYSAIHNNINVASIDPCYYAIMLFCYSLTCYIFCYSAILLIILMCTLAIIILLFPYMQAFAIMLYVLLLIIVTSPYMQCLVAFFSRIPCYCILAGIYDSYIGPKNGNIKIAEARFCRERIAIIYSKWV